MNNARQLVNKLKSHDINLMATNDNLLIVDAPKGKITSDLRQVLNQNKQDIIYFLKTTDEIQAQHSTPLKRSSEWIGEPQNLVSCIDCDYFEKDTIGSGAGVGNCKKGRVPIYPEFPLYPYARRYCELINFKKKNLSSNSNSSPKDIAEKQMRQVALLETHAEE